MKFFRLELNIKQKFSKFQRIFSNPIADSHQLTKTLKKNPPSRGELVHPKLFLLKQQQTPEEERLVKICKNVTGNQSKT